MTFRQKVLLCAGPVLLLLTLLLPAPSSEMSQAAWSTCGLMAWMVLWWISEVVPIPVTSLLPMIFIPLLSIDSMSAATSPYANPIIYLFFGGFFLSIAMEKTGLHRRIALSALSLVGAQPSRQIAALMAVTAFLSMWMSNTATAVMMLPIGLSIIAMAGVSDQSKFAKAILLGIAYSASIGGVATLIGTPPNALLAAYLQKTYQMQISFADWMLIGVPIASLMLVICWLWLTQFHFKLPASTNSSATQFKQQLAGEGPLPSEQKWVLLVFVLAAFCWVFQQWLASTTGLAISDTLIALGAATLLFLLPGKAGKTLLEWQDAQQVPWGVLLLFGAGLSMADQIQKTGVAQLLAQQLQMLQGVEPVLLLLAVTSLIIFLTEVTSNTATAAAFLPLLGPVAVSMELSPLYLALPAALAASFAFMLPVATPPNAIVFASGKLEIKDMARAGLVLNVLGILVIALFSHYLAPHLFV
ncbi:SLC13 family permease [Rheinheimera marina]|uniref:SLC13 family permease n=1 Tax=Rheinheimera marina TaxID=1774958 RepID=A0ABV9JJV0_9GAMM